MRRAGRSRLGRAGGPPRRRSLPSAPPCPRAARRSDLPLAPALALLGGRRGRGRRGPRPALSVDEIVAAAIAVADAEGLEAVSMARVAADLGFTTMSLYRYG